jgi:ABC-type dipeptide/oligopeptide/nickel transport system permease component
VLTFAIRRILLAIPLILGATMIAYVAVSLASNPLSAIATCTNCNATAEQAIIERYNLDQSIPERYIDWLGGAIRGDLGEATSQGDRPVSEILPERTINTLYLAVPAFFLTASTALLLAVWSALRQYKFDDYAITAFSYIGLAMPTFFFGILLQQFWGIYVPEHFGVKPFNVQGFSTASFGEYLRYATLPIITLAIISIAGESRFGRAAMLDLKNSDFIRTARAKGAKESVVVRRHLIRNAMIPIATIWALDAAALMGGAVVTESIFSWPGLGRMLITGITSADVDMVMGVVVILSVLTVAFNLIADLTYGWLDPRIRYD